MCLTQITEIKTNPIVLCNTKSLEEGSQMFPSERNDKCLREVINDPGIVS